MNSAIVASELTRYHGDLLAVDRSVFTAALSDFPI
jgi:hypothetical protein